ncbi:MAG: MATE family efflux transporter [bacterium]|nr:MATE family efflux transporter [bacterium]
MFTKIKTYKNLFLQTAKLAYPITIGQLGLVLMGLTDTIMLGRVSNDAMGAASIGNAIFFLFMLIGVGALYAVSTFTAIADGEAKPQQSIPIFISSLRINIWLSLALILINLILYYNFDMLGQTPAVTAQGAEYLWIVNFSIPAMLYYNSGKQMMDGLSKTQISMGVTFFGVALNVLLNWAMIFGHWGFPALGLVGSAWASVISRYAMAVLMLYLSWYHPYVKELKTRVIDHIRYDIEILKIGLPIGLTFFFEMGAFTFALVMCGWISEIHLAAHQIAIQLASLTYMFITGIAAGGNILVGNFYGAKDKIGVRKAGFAAILLSLAVEGVFAIIFLIFSGELPKIYTEDTAVIEMAQQLLFLAALFQLSDGIQAVAAGVLRGIKDTKITGIIAFVSYWIIMVPGAYLLCFKFNWGIEGIWFAFIFGLTFAAIWLLNRFFNRSMYNKLVFED